MPRPSPASPRRDPWWPRPLWERPPRGLRWQSFRLPWPLWSSRPRARPSRLPPSNRLPSLRHRPRLSQLHLRLQPRPPNQLLPRHPQNIQCLPLRQLPRWKKRNRRRRKLSSRSPQLRSKRLRKSPRQRRPFPPRLCVASSCRRLARVLCTRRHPSPPARPLPRHRPAVCNADAPFLTVGHPARPAALSNARPALPASSPAVPGPSTQRALHPAVSPAQALPALRVPVPALVRVLALVLRAPALAHAPA